MFTVLKNSLLSLVFPRFCSVCNGQVDLADDGAACRECWESTRIFNGQEMLCTKCGAFFNETGAAADVRCRKCDDHHYDRAAAAGIYEKALASAVIALKSMPVLPGTPKTAFLDAFSRSDFHDATKIIAIPLSKRRLVERGFNQAGVLAESLSRHAGVELDGHSLIRTTHSPIHRIAMDKKARELTVRNAFDVTRPKLIEGHNILLVDDVFTSGATSSSCAKALKKNGAAKVVVLTLARAVMN